MDIFVTTGQTLMSSDTENESCRRMSLLVPVVLGLIQGWKHERQGATNIVADQTEDVLIIPVVQGPLSHLSKTCSRVTHQN